jgi:uncharacterized protein (TIGR03000 family)
MSTWKFLMVTGSTLLFGGLAAGDAPAQMRRMSMPVSPMPVAMQSMLPMQPLTTMQPLYPNTGVPSPSTNPWLQGAYNPLLYPWLQGAYMTNGYGNSTPYVSPALSSVGAYPTGVTSKMNDVVVKLPIANAKIWINGVETKGTGLSSRHVSVPDAPVGQKNEFTIKATWTIDGNTKSDERTVPLNGSGRQVVNFLVPEGK